MSDYSKTFTRASGADMFLIGSSLEQLEVFGCSYDMYRKGKLHIKDPIDERDTYVLKIMFNSETGRGVVQRLRGMKLTKSPESQDNYLVYDFSFKAMSEVVTS
jgi:hypothetical protein